jgi:hypothetical protein
MNLIETSVNVSRTDPENTANIYGQEWISNGSCNGFMFSCVPLSPQHGASWRCGWRDGLQQCRVAVNILNKQQRINDKGWSSSWGMGVGLTTPHHKNQASYEMYQ